MGGKQHRRDVDVLPAAASAPQASKVNEHAGAPEPRTETPNVSGTDLPERGQLSAFGARAGGGDRRRLGGGDALFEYGVLARAVEGTEARVGAGGLRANGSRTVDQPELFWPGLRCALQTPQTTRRRASLRPGQNNRKCDVRKNT